jgi:hypothetical protein
MCTNTKDVLLEHTNRNRRHPIGYLQTQFEGGRGGSSPRGGRGGQQGQSHNTSSQAHSNSNSSSNHPSDGPTVYNPDNEDSGVLWCPHHGA